MPTLDEHRDLIQIIAMLILLVTAGIGVLDSRVSSEWRIAEGTLMALAAWTLWRAIRRMRKGGTVREARQSDEPRES